MQLSRTTTPEGVTLVEFAMLPSLGYGSTAPIACHCPHCRRDTPPKVHPLFTQFAGVPIFASRLMCDDCDRALAQGRLETVEQRAAREHETMAALRLPSVMQGWTLESHPNKASVRQVQHWLDRVGPKPSLVLFGDSGTGKTGIAVGLLRRMADRGLVGRFEAVYALIRRIRDTYSHGATETEWGIMKPLIASPLLVLDDVTTVKHSEHTEDALHAIIDGRLQEGRPTIITANIAAEVMPNTFGGPTFDRLRGGALFIEISGRSHRTAVNI